MDILFSNIKNIPRKKFPSVFIFLFYCLISLITKAWSAEYSIVQLTHNNYNDWYPRIYNNQVVWQGYDGNDSEIFFYDGAQIKKLTNNSYNDGSFNYQIQNGQVVWEGYDGKDYEIFLYDGIQTRQLTNDSYNDTGPWISNGQVAWSVWDGNDSEIFLYDGSQTMQLTNNDYSDILVGIDNGQVVWEGYDGNDFEIFLYDGIQTRQLTNDSYNDLYPQISSGQVVWNKQVASEWRILFYNGIQTMKIMNDGSSPQIHNGQITWYGWDGNDFEIFFYDGIQTRQLTDNNYDDWEPKISNGQVVWWVWWGSNNYEIFVYDGVQTARLTQNNYADWSPQIHNNQIAWFGYDGNDWEIFLATSAAVNQSILEILDGSDFSAGREISSDLQKLATGGTPVEGAVTDGVTRLLLRLPLGQLNEVTFSLEGDTGNPKEDGILKSIDSQQQGNSITVSTHNVDSKEYAFAIYQAPENFVRPDIDKNNDGKPDDEAISERTITLRVKSNRFPSFEFFQEIRLVRPPVILVHGLWSSKEMWDGFRVMLQNKTPGIQIFTVNYRETNASYLEVNKDKIKDKIEEVKKDLRSQGVVMIQADVIGHSMGGLLARIYAVGEEFYGKGWYLNDKNFKEGDINKLITLDSPHFGSFLADFVMEYIDILARIDPGRIDSFLKDMRETGFPLDEGAIEELMTASPKILQMNTLSMNPYSHAIVGDAKVDFRIGITMLCDSGESFEVILETGVGTEVGPSDLVVSVESQAGGLVPPQSSTFTHWHCAATGEEVADKAIELLNTEAESSSFAPGFPVNRWPL